MFYTDGIIVKSNIIDADDVLHAFSTRLGGVSTHPHTASMNLAPGHGDDEITVLKNTDILVSTMSKGKLSAHDAIVTSQIHSAKIRYVTEENRGEGAVRAVGESCDGFVTDRRGIALIVRTADCVPIIFSGRKNDGKPVVAAVHAGWRGTVAGIAAVAVRQMCQLGATAESIRVAVGPHIGFCCFEVGDDLFEAVCDARGLDFAERHIKKIEGFAKKHADLSAMNKEILLDAGVLEKNIDISLECTCCDNLKYHSHRKTKGLRGAMGNVIAIV